ncbi:hypothetical protein B0J13DRAFT_616670 [Dactylonectria estremocensis]|uniref:Phytocyanin domain-containing protein n=1 Tax=Dactylonectria estremocensis TaxID=1079267 RepID=A0A9P9FDL6_9HYPO|nr:hypothetical protein B0J13DRAFT_616670 [Dactylonectria estremocensis]
MLPRSLLAVSIFLMGAWAQETDETRRLTTSATDASTTTESTAATDASTTTDASSTVEESATGTSTGTGVTTHTVAVGASGHKFTPSELTADVGDIIEWRFYPTNHWVIRGDFDYPCIPYEYIGTDRTGFSSGSQTVQAITDDGPRFRVRVNNTDPIFFYCGAPGSCVRYHMMGVINPASNDTLDDWLTKAEDVDYQLRPGDPWPTEEGFETPTDAATTETGGSSNNNDNSDEDNSNSNKGTHLGAGAIAGIAIGGVAVLLLGGAMIYLCGRRGGFDKAYRKSFRNSAAPEQFPNVQPPVAETRFDSPSTAAGSAYKQQPSPMSAAFSQSPPMSPHHPSQYGFQPGYNPMVAQDGTIGSYYSDHNAQHLGVPIPTESPKPQDQIAPVELPASGDPGNSPLPEYNNNGTQRTFSWAGEESGYRPSK